MSDAGDLMASDKVDKNSEAAGEQNESEDPKDVVMKEDAVDPNSVADNVDLPPKESEAVDAEPDEEKVAPKSENAEEKSAGEGESPSHDANADEEMAFEVLDEAVEPGTPAQDQEESAELESPEKTEKETAKSESPEKNDEEPAEASQPEDDVTNLSIVDEVGGDDERTEGENKQEEPEKTGADASKSETESNIKEDNKKAPSSASAEALSSFVGLLSKLQKIPPSPKSILKKPAASAGTPNSSNAEPKKKARPAPKSIKLAREKMAQSATTNDGNAPAGKEHTSDEIATGVVPKSPSNTAVIPRNGKGFWNLLRSAELLNRALDYGVEGVVLAEPYDVVRRPNDPKSTKPVIKCRGKLSCSKSVRIARTWLNSAKGSEGRMVGLFGPFNRYGRDIRMENNFEKKVYGCPKQCNVGLGRHEEPGGPYISIGYPEMHGFPEESIEVYKQRPPVARVLEQTGAELERLSDLMAVCLETFFSSLQQIADKSPEFATQLHTVAPQIVDLRDISALLSNRAVANMDILCSGMDDMTARKYLMAPPSRILFPKPTGPNAPRVVPKRKWQAPHEQGFKRRRDGGPPGNVEPFRNADRSSYSNEHQGHDNRRYRENFNRNRQDASQNFDQPRQDSPRNFNRQHQDSFQNFDRQRGESYDRQRGDGAPNFGNMQDARSALLSTPEAPTQLKQKELLAQVENLIRSAERKLNSYDPSPMDNRRV
ncbi:unnamed protein product [Notodromas monacha]|uniref:Uncharacterized protein n=1 Tax=Notodromas monacha TaxID=399045 RepID=A0A7R9BHE6_9CRUS|nr:unnamed protein product [Notodromas monacha]CAG0915541.1 unnamed protein product [Notodromas monacha]